MKIKLMVTMILMLLFAAFALNSFPLVRGQDTIKIGIIGPQGLPHWSPAGMKEAAELARDEINAAGGIDVGGTLYTIELLFGNEYSYPTINPTEAANEVAFLISQGAQFIIGGFRTECTVAMIEVAMAAQIPFFINGASTDLLITDTVGQDYEYYKYLFRNNPINSTMLFNNIGGYLGGYLIPQKLAQMYGSPVKVSVITEDLAWTNEMHAALTNPAVYPYILGPNATVVHDDRLYNAAPEVLQQTMLDVIASEARLMIHVFSGLDGATLIGTWRAMGVQALPVGINVLAQLQTFWSDTGGACEYEIIMNFVGTRTPINPGVTEVFWDNFVAHSGGAWPIYTAFGAYDSIYGLKEAIEAAETLDPNALVPFLEATDRIQLNGRFKYTQDHDVFTQSFGPVWPDGYVRGMMVQWSKPGIMEVVTPIDQSYSRTTKIPTWMYELAGADLTLDGIVNIYDMFIPANAWQTVPGDANWNFEADSNADGIVDISDLFPIASHWQESALEWPLP